MKFERWAEEWLADRPVKWTTRRLYRSHLDRFLIPYFGGMPVVRIAAIDVRRWYKRLEDADRRAGRGDVQRAQSYRLLHAILRTAVDDGLIARNPCGIRSAGVDHSPERPTLRIEDVWALADEIAPHLRALVLVAGIAGLRRGELLGLRRGDVDVDGRRLRVERQVVQTGAASRVIEPPKSAAGIRTIVLPGVLAEELAMHLGLYSGPDPDDFVFVGVNGAPLSISSLQPAFVIAREKCGLDGVHLHDLRHVAATTFAGLGATMRETMAQIGHSTPAAAMRYQHAAQSRMVDLADRLEVVSLAGRRAAREAVANAAGVTGNGDRNMTEAAGADLANDHSSSFRVL